MEISEDGARLTIGRCSTCLRAHFPFAADCPWCGAEACAADRGGPWARLWLWTAVTSRPPGYRGPVPYGFGVVELEDVPLRVVTRLTEADPAKLYEGQRLQLVLDEFFTDDDGTAIAGWAFTPAAVD